MGKLCRELPRLGRKKKDKLSWEKAFATVLSFLFRNTDNGKMQLELQQPSYNHKVTRKTEKANISKDGKRKNAKSLGLNDTVE